MEMLKMEIPINPPPEPASDQPIIYEVVRETWLTRKPHSESFFVAMFATFSLAIGSAAYWQNWFHMADLMPATYQSVFTQHEYWRLWTTIFAHADLGHIISNSFLFFILGYFLYGYFGAKLFPLAALLGGGLANAFVLPSYEPEMTLIGASGVVYWMGGAWLILYFFLSRQKNLSHRILRTLGVGILLFMPAETFEPSVSYRTHFAGFVIGVLSGLFFYWRHRRKFLSAEVRQTIVEEPEVDIFAPDTRLEYYT